MPETRVVVSRRIVNVHAAVRGVIAAPVATLALWAPLLLAADWRVTPRATVRETYSDNIRLAPRGQEESDFVTEVAPGISITGTGSRLSLQADYAFRYRLYGKHSELNGHDHSLSSRAFLDVWDRKLFLEASANIAQQDISPLGPRASSDVNVNPNRTEVRQATVSPYWVSRLGTFGMLNARYTWNRMTADGAASSLDSQAQKVDLGVSSGTDFANLGWSLTYSRQEVESSRGQFTTRDLETITGTLSYRIMPSLVAFTNFGRDDHSYGSLSGETGGNFYSAGLRWTPSTRTEVSGELGKRYFGDTAAFNAQFRTRLTTWNLTYSEQIVATPGTFSVPLSLDTAATLDRLFLSQIPDPIERQQVVQAFIAQNGLPPSLQTSVDFLTNQVSLSKRLQGVFGMRGTRGTLLVTVYRDNRSQESTGQAVFGGDPFALSNKVIQTGYSTVLTWRVSPQTAASVSLGQTRSELADVDRKDTNSNIRLGITHELHPKLRGALEYRWTNRDSNASASDVRENAVTGTLSLTF